LKFKLYLTVVHLMGAGQFMSSKYKSGQEEIFADRANGQIPKVMNIDDSELDWNEAGTTFFISKQDEIFINEYKRVIEREYNLMTQSEYPIDFLILVPGAECKQYFWTRSALKDLNYEFTDYVDESNRRTIAQVSKIRLCTYFSSRGLEGTRVIIFGFEALDSFSKIVKTPPNKIGYVILSRAVFQNILVFRNSSKSNSIDFIYKTLSLLHEVT